MDSVLPRVSAMENSLEALVISAATTPITCVPASTGVEAPAAVEAEISIAIARWQETHQQLAQCEKDLAMIRFRQRKSEDTARFLRVLEAQKGHDPKVAEDKELKCLWKAVARFGTEKDNQRFVKKLRERKNRANMVMKIRLDRHMNADELNQTLRIALIEDLQVWYAKQARSFEKMASRHCKMLLRLRAEERNLSRKVCSFSLIRRPLPYGQFKQFHQTEEAKRKIAPATISKPHLLYRPSQPSRLRQS